MKKDTGVVKRVFVTPDKHFPLHDKKAISVVKKAIEIVKPDVYVDLGDVGEWHGCSHWQWKKKKRPPLEYQLPFIDKDVKDVNKGMDSIDESLDKANCKEKYMIEGNHDDWMNRFVDENPYLTNYRFKECVKLTGFVNSTDEFIDQPKVINGASDLIASVFGDNGMHTRAAVSTNSLPLGVAVEVDAIFELN